MEIPVTETVWNIAYPKWNILQLRFQLREDIDCHSQTPLSVHTIVFFSKQEKIHGDIEEHCQLNGNFNRTYLYSVLNFNYVGSTI